MIDYAKHKPHPTKYAGIRFRSRLEARWAAFFDLAGVLWMYEPMDLGAWSPDFLIQLCGISTLVEIKPITEADPSVIARMAGAIPWEQFSSAYLLGLAPRPWAIHTWTVYAMGWAIFPPSTIEAGSQCWDEMSEIIWPKSIHDKVPQLWAEACNTVQWSPRA